MDSGWAVILGAVIALAGSALIPWWRESRARARDRVDHVRDRTNDAIVDFLTHDVALGFAYAVGDRDRIQTALESRERAGTRLLLEVPHVDRVHIAALLATSLPVKTDEDASWGTRAKVLQTLLVDWATGDVTAEEAISRYRNTAGRPTE